MNMYTNYLGFDLAHPLIPGALPLADHLDSVRALEDAGAPMIIMRSLFEEQIVGEQLATLRATETMADTFAEASSFLADPDGAVFGPHQYLDQIRRTREVVGIPVVASLNGTTRGGWLGYAQLIEQAGASALELNIYELPTDGSRSGEDLEREAVEMVRELRNAVSLPLAIKLSPFYASFAHFADQLDTAGADAIVIFNRFYQPDIDIEELETIPLLNLSDSSELLLRLRWLAILSGRIDADLAITGGVHEAPDAIKALMCGAQAVQLVSSLLIRGPEHLTQLRDDLGRWLEDHGYESIDQLRGSMSLESCPDPTAFERTNYMQILQSWRI